MRTPLAQGATHVLVLRSRRPLTTDVDTDASSADGAHGVNGSAVPRPPRSIRLLTRTTLRNESLALRTALLTRRVRTAADVARIVAMEAEGRALMIYWSYEPEDGSAFSVLTGTRWNRLLHQIR